MAMIDDAPLFTKGQGQDKAIFDEVREKNEIPERRWKGGQWKTNPMFFAVRWCRGKEREEPQVNICKKKKKERAGKQGKKECR